MEKLIYKPDSQLISSFQAISGNEDLLFQVVGLFPLPIKIFTPNGNAVFVSRALLEAWNISDDSQIVGKFNLREDPVTNEKLGLREFVRRALDGETVLVKDARAPLEDMALCYQARSDDYNIESMYTDILSFPIWSREQALQYIVSMFITTRIYQGQADIARAKEFIENHWKEDFDMDRIADAVHLSRYHFARLFKKHTGMTPYSYYQHIKVRELKNALCDKNLSVADAFAACGVEYSGNYARVFRDKVGMTPSQYRKHSIF